MMDIRPVRNDDDWQAAKRIREEVFIKEQACTPEEEWDEHDATARHFLLWADQEPIGTARWRATRFNEKPVAKLERFAILNTQRGQGYGRALIRFVIKDAEEAGFDTQYIHAQTHLKRLYASFGFTPVGEEFEEAGIPHIAMLRR